MTDFDRLNNDDRINPEAFATLNEDVATAPRRITTKNTSRGEKEDPGADAAREAFFSQRGRTQPPGGKAGAWARRMAGKAVG